MSHRTVPKGAGEHRAARTPPPRERELHVGGSKHRAARTPYVKPPHAVEGSRSYSRYSSIHVGIMVGMRMQLPYRRLLTGVRVFDIPPCSVLSSRITDRPTRRHVTLARTTRTRDAPLVYCTTERGFYKRLYYKRVVVEHLMSHHSAPSGHEPSANRDEYVSEPYGIIFISFVNRVRAGRYLARRAGRLDSPVTHVRRV